MARNRDGRDLRLNQSTFDWEKGESVLRSANMSESRLLSVVNNLILVTCQIERGIRVISLIPEDQKREVVKTFVHRYQIPQGWETIYEVRACCVN